MAYKVQDRKTYSAEFKSKVMWTGGGYDAHLFVFSPGCLLVYGENK